VGSLRTRILATYALVVAFSLLLAGIVALLLLDRYQHQATLARTRALAVALSADLPDLVGARRAGLPAETLQRLRREAAALGGRFLVTSADGTVLQDTADSGNLVGQRLRLPAQPARREWRRFRAPDGTLYYFTTLPLQRPAARDSGQAPHRYLVLAVAAGDLKQAWRSLVALLALAGALALAASLAVGFFLSRSITRPLRALTQATQQLARGRYDQRVPVQGDDELAELASGFNAMAQQVQRARQTERDFLTNVTHDLRTPLTSIQGFSQALLEGTVDDAASYRQAAAIIQEETGRMRRLIDDLLDLASLEAHVVELRRERLELTPWLPALVEPFAARAQTAGLTLQTRLEEPLPAVPADARRLEQAIANLLDNAIKYTPPAGSITLGARSVQVRRGQVEPRLGGQVVVDAGHLRSGPWAAIQVADTGRGVPPEDVERIFERFYRADKARTETAGSGLGLSIVREIVLAHRGLIAVQSTLGQGTTFTLLLPADRS